MPVKRSIRAGSVANMLTAVLLAACSGSPGGSPTPIPLEIAAVTNALGNAGITVSDVADNLNPHEGAWACLPGSFRLARVSQQPAGPIARPGDRPSVDILLYPTEAARLAAQGMIGADGQVHAAGCATMVEWIASPHVFGAGNVMLFIATDDPAQVAAVQVAAASLGRTTGQP